MRYTLTKIIRSAAPVFIGERGGVGVSFTSLVRIWYGNFHLACEMLYGTLDHSCLHRNGSFRMARLGTYYVILGNPERIYWFGILPQ